MTYGVAYRDVMLEKALSDGAWPHMASLETQDDEPLFFLFLVAKKSGQAVQQSGKEEDVDFEYVVKKREIYD